ncbi:MAG TPA: SDR family NAD(P)-dependent oxidoreductase, partial [Actinomycetes bacterium]|nr:SDR family NAD(P)-dependent oxidoreductase [Actinomycetes bacterium]
MLERRAGWILNVASIGAYQPSPLYASYSAAKSFILDWTEALSYELRGSGVVATCVSSGGRGHRVPPGRGPAGRPLPAAGQDGQPDRGPLRRRRGRAAGPSLWTLAAALVVLATVSFASANRVGG